MKQFESHFIDYINNSKKSELYTLPDNISSIDNMTNIIIYGPQGIGKYTYALNLIKHITSNNLKYEKKITITYNKSNYYFKISDIHYEIDMSLLGCNSKLLWFEIYNQIIDIISAKNVKCGIILCKNFNDIHNELLETFYSYMQTRYNSSLTIKFIIITSDISFLPNNIVNCCKKIVLPRPSRSSYNKIYKVKIDKNYNINKINNIKDIKRYDNSLFTNHNTIMQHSHKSICDQILEQIINYDEIKFLQLRENLYDICIFDLNIYNCINYIIKELINKNLLSSEKLNKVLLNQYNFMRLYNNNYRPIYHLEKYILYISAVVNELL
jgi:DNA polymerase III delta prime subunit